MLNGACSAGLSWETVWSFALSVTLGCCRVSWSAQPALQVLYSDACAARRSVGVCSCDGRRGLTAVIPANLMRGYARAPDAQQTAELYGVTLAVTCAAVTGKHLLLLPDSSACVGWFSGLRLPPTRPQAQLLFSADILQALSGIEVTVRWVQVPMNLADPGRALRRQSDLASRPLDAALCFPLAVPCFTAASGGKEDRNFSILLMLVHMSPLTL